MLDHSVDTYDEPLMVIQTKLQQCEDALASLTFIVHKQRWEQLDQYVSDYQHAIADLQQSMQGKHKLPTALLHQFQHLSTEQRRVMRSIHQQMQQTTDDIASLDHGITKLHHVAQLQSQQHP